MESARRSNATARFVRRRTLAWAGAALAGTLLAGCARLPGVGNSGQLSPGQPGTPTTQAVAQGFSVSCAPGQRTLIRQVVSDGQPVTDVRCVADAQAQGAATQPFAADGYSPTPAGYAADPRQAVAATYPADAVVPRTSWAPVNARPLARTVAYRTDGDTLTYEPRRPRRVSNGRTWQKSAVIIGSSAGLAAGVGAAIGGKRGALIGAALGGGSAAIWDQATRRR